MYEAAGEAPSGFTGLGTRPRGDFLVGGNPADAFGRNPTDATGKVYFEISGIFGLGFLPLFLESIREGGAAQAPS